MEKEQTNKVKEHLCTCPVCGEEYEEEIFKDGVWHCKLCGILYYSPECRSEIDALLNDEKCQKIFTAYVREHWQKTHKPTDINPQVIRQVLKNQGIVK